MKYSEKNAFTLVELLLAMFLFAIIASLLVPKISQDAERQLFVTQLGKVQNDVQQAFLMMITENQSNLAGYCSDSNANECLVNNMGKYLENNCIFPNADFKYDSKDNIPVARNPEIQATAYEKRKPLFINKTTEAAYKVNEIEDKDNFKAIYLKDGAYVSVVYAPACDKTSYDIGATTATKVCGYIEVDLNAGKAPNMVGKDIHYFWIHPTDGIIPFGEIDGFTCENVKGIPKSDENAKTDAKKEESLKNNTNAYKAGSLGCTSEVIEKQKITYY